MTDRSPGTRRTRSWPPAGAAPRSAWASLVSLTCGRHRRVRTSEKRVTPRRWVLQTQSDGGAELRALVVRQFGDPDAIELVETDTPVPGPGEVRIKVAAAAVNPVDLATATGVLVEFGVARPRDQFGLGWDVAGTVDAVGSGVTACSRAARWSASSTCSRGP
ncbi:MAG: alcohol dehydrogenase catalytic domain-containing protein [Kribbellaceae bacterium]